MSSGSLHVKVGGALQTHIQRQTRDEAWEWLQKELSAGMRAADSEFVSVSAKDVVSRNQKPSR